MEIAFLQSYIYNVNIEVNAADCTDQHFGGGCSKTVVELKFYKIEECDMKRKDLSLGLSKETKSQNSENRNGERLRFETI